MTRRIPLLATLLVPTLALASGCDLFSQLSQHTGIVDVFTTSHGTPDDEGNLPSHNGHQLVFTNDMGWDVFIDEAYVTTSAVTLLACDGERFDIEMYWGAQAENLGATADAELAAAGGVRANAGTYCDLVVEYGPADTVDNPAAMGATVYLAGSAVMGDQHIDFIWRSDIELETQVDISDIEAGQPFAISTEQHFSKKLTVSKTYNHFFDGVDFNDELSQADIDDLVADSLDRGTVAFEGTNVH
ncbi:hypothetical protein ENSA5_05460 [Enhygromyxa salina]|uniref:Lipoprotein n=1 Tax=Enhygromyxa salina TaxID=215803 RepID=A0A2S9YHV2_9BACT|nr:hypothetical protein [Enhygromyxa salina]PRQ04697.1 hypothetical protein ENSA5_05460 [Enhygromyxa salina]